MAEQTLLSKDEIIRYDLEKLATFVNAAQTNYDFDYSPGTPEGEERARKIFQPGPLQYTEPTKADPFFRWGVAATSDPMVKMWIQESRQLKKGGVRGDWEKVQLRFVKERLPQSK